MTFYDLVGDDDEHPTGSQRIARALSDPSDSLTPKEWALAYNKLTRAYMGVLEENDHLRMQLLFTANSRTPQ